MYFKLQSEEGEAVALRPCQVLQGKEGQKMENGAAILPWV